MERIQELIADISRYFSQLTKRERILVAVAAAGMVLFVGSIVYSSVSRRISRHEMSIEEKLLAFEQVAVYAQTFTESERERKELERRLSGEPIRLLSFMQKLAEKHGLSIGSMSERGENTVDQVKESLIELQIAAAPIDKLTKMLDEIEREPRILKVRKLRLRPVTGSETDMNVTLTVGAYQLVKS